MSNKDYIEMSSNVKDLENIDLDKIVDDQTLSDNIFIKKLIESNKDLKQTDYPKFDNILSIYFERIKDLTFYRKKNSFIIFFIRLFELLFYVTIFFGVFLPKKLLKVHIIIIIVLLILNEFLDGKCIFSLVIKRLSNSEYHDLIPISNKFKKSLFFTLMFLSIYSVLVPQYSLYRLTIIFFKLLNDFDDN